MYKVGFDCQGRGCEETSRIPGKAGQGKSRAFGAVLIGQIGARE